MMKNLYIEQTRPSQFFKYEMQILNYSKMLTRSERCQRFSDLINMDFSEKTEGESRFITSQLVGANLIWIRASFDRKSNEMVKINSWVNLTVELFTYLKGDGLEVEEITARFNDQ